VTSQTFDSGPLSWVKPEIDHALERARQCLDRFASNPADGNELKAAKTHLHQVTGAVQVVGLHGLARFAEETENLLAVLSQREPSVRQKTIVVLRRALAALAQYLDELMNSQPNVPGRLFPVFKELCEAQGATDISEVELFFPDLDRRPPHHPAPEPVAEDLLPAFIKRQRARFERGLLAFLKNDPQGVGVMGEALAAVERAQPLPVQRTFWWAAAALIEAIHNKGVAASAAIRKVCMRIDLQMKNLSAGSAYFAERLLRDVLYYVALSEPVGERIRSVKELYELDDHIVRDIAAPLLDREVEQHQVQLREAKEVLRVAKDVWVKYSSGNPDTLTAFRERAQKLKEIFGEMANAPLAKLADLIERVSAKLPSHLKEKREEIALEMATALLVAENAVDRYTEVNPELGRQVDAVTARLLGALSDKPARIPDVDLLGEIGRKAHEKMLLAQVVNEVQSNLQQIEQVLDSFFRNASKREQLTGLDPFVRQILGALRMMGLETAVKLLSECDALIKKFAASSEAPSEHDLNLLADGLSSLGFYIQGFHLNQSDSEQMMIAVLRRLNPNAIPLFAVETEILPKPSLEVEMEDEKQKARGLYNKWRKDPHNDALKDDLQTSFKILHQAARLTADVELGHQTEIAVEMLSQSDARPDSFMTQAVATIIGPPPAAAPSREVAHLIQAEPDQVDRELLQIYLQEADEVLATIAEHLEMCREQPHHREAMTTIRRGFHTLKGSGRMVGLTDLGEAAWEVEQTMNQWLQLERNATPALITFLSETHESFSHWVKTLSEEGRVEVDSRKLSETARQLRGDLETATSVGRVEVPAPPAPVAAEPVPEVVAESPAPPAEAPAPSAEMLVPQPEGMPAEAAAAVSEEAPEAAAQPEEAPAEETISFGGVTISPSLYKIYVEEAAQHLSTLQSEFAEWRKAPTGAPPHAFMRAAHTLSGISRTAGFLDIAELGFSLEQWLLQLRRKPHDPGATGILNSGDAIEKLVDMVEAIGKRRPPPAADRERHEIDQMLAAAIAKQTAVEQDYIAVGGEEIAPTVSEPISTFVSLAEVEDANVPELSYSAEPLATQPVPPPIEAVAPQVESRAERRRIRDDIDTQLLPIFLQEAQELIPLLGEDLRLWKAEPQNARASQSVRRSLHTLKGSARMVGAMRLGELIHNMESAVAETIENGEISPDLFEGLELRLDRAVEALEALERGEEFTEEPLEKAAEVAADQTPAAGPAPDILDYTSPKSLIRVRADVVDQLVNSAGEISIARTRVESEMRAFKQTLMELSDSVTRLRAQLREIEIQAESQMQSQLSRLQERDADFDPLEFDRYTRLQELTRMMAESVHDVTTVQQNLFNNLDESDAALLAQGRLNRTLQDELMRIRTVPFATIVERLYRVVRQTAKDVGKRANLEVTGTHVELDRSVLEKIAAPLEHLLRNAIVHGLESPEQRVAMQKPEFGEIVLALKQEANEIVLTISDDGSGLNVERIRGKAVELGLINHEDHPTSTQIGQFIFNPGFTTATEVSEVAGRGVGMDVVRTDIQALGGRVEVSSEQGRGTTFSLFVPLTLAVAQAVIVRAGARLFAIPSNMVEQVQEYKSSALDNVYATRELQWLGHTYPFHYLPRVLGDSEYQYEPKPYNCVMLLKSGDIRLAIHVDELVRTQEVVLKNIGPQLSRVPGISGATVMPNGQPVLVLNPVQIASRDYTPISAHVATRIEKASGAPIVMVVDDSLTVRKITGRLLSRLGYQVVSAKDGVDALQQLQDITPDVMLVDIEMPRMDGFDLTKNLRRDPTTANIPIIMITSRTADKHRTHALQLGVNVFLGKPYQEEELIRHIETFVEQPAHQPAASSVKRLLHPTA
jgi:chemosensory pili system protein ChpA (sensor histidine kinase/response regulator)